LDLLTNTWPDTRHIFKIRDIQKLVGKIARLGEGAPWIFKIIPHVYTSQAFALKQNELLLCHCSPAFCKIVTKIEWKQFTGNQCKFTKELNFCFKDGIEDGQQPLARLYHKTMRKEL
jgi:hypothetical protein